MAWTDYLGLLGGLALFLYGMRLMSDGMELLAGSRLKRILERLTRSRFAAMGIGFALTAVVQSSNAITSMTVGFVNAGLMEFPRAIGIIMGSNIGTTVTGQLIALDASSVAPAIAFAGTLLYLFFRKRKLRHIGQILLGLGFLFMGMKLMSGSMAPLKEDEWFRSAITQFSNPFVGVLVGTVFTLMIQSSSASVGVLQALALQGLIGLDSAIYVICGQNIGCTIAAIMAAAGGNKGAKRTAAVHLLFNVSGTAIFMLICRLTPFTEWVAGMTPLNGAAQIANAHTIFNVATTLILLPLSGLLAKAATLIVRGDDAIAGPTQRLLHITKNFGAASLGIAQVEAEIGRMEGLSAGNMRAAFEALFVRRPDLEEVHQQEETIDYLNKEITRALVRLNAMELLEKDAAHISSMYHVISDLERIGDHAENIAGYAEFMASKDEKFSDEAEDELKALREKVFAIMDGAYAHFKSPAEGGLERIEALEEEIDSLVEEMQEGHIRRLSANECNPDMGMLFVEILTDLERAADHALNIAEAAR